MLISCMGGPSALFRFSLDAAPSLFLSTLQIKTALCLQGNSQRTHSARMLSLCARWSWWDYCHSGNRSIYQKTGCIDPPHFPRSLETLPQLSRHKLNEVSTSNKCVLLKDLSLLQCFNQCVTVGGPPLFLILRPTQGWKPVVAVELLSLFWTFKVEKESSGFSKINKIFHDIAF